MAEETRQENAVRSGDDVTCPNCGSHNVRCIPYPKVEFGTVADRCIRRLYDLDIHHNRRHHFLEHCFGDSPETE